MITINLRLITALPFYAVGLILALLALWYQIASVISIFTLDVLGFVLNEIFFCVAAALASGAVLIGNKIKGETE